MSEEKDQAQMALEWAQAESGHLDTSGDDVRGVVPSCSRRRVCRSGKGRGAARTV